MRVKIRIGGRKRWVALPVVACKEFHFGTVIRFSYHGRVAWGIVEDRGPYIGGRKFDFLPRLQHDLRIRDGVVKVHYRVIGKLKKHYKWKKWPGLITGRTKLYKHKR